MPGHPPCDLSEVPQVVHDPRCRQLPERHAPQARVLTGEIELPRGEPPRAQQLEFRGAQLGELGEQGLQGAVCVARAVTEAIVALEAEVRAPTKHDASSWDPVGFLAV